MCRYLNSDRDIERSVIVKISRVRYRGATTDPIIMGSSHLHISSIWRDMSLSMTLVVGPCYFYGFPSRLYCGKMGFRIGSVGSVCRVW